MDEETPLLTELLGRPGASMPGLTLLLLHLSLGEQPGLGTLRAPSKYTTCSPSRLLG